MPNQLRQHPPEEIVAGLTDWTKHERAKYLYSLIHPEFAVQEGVQVKLYSDAPIPSSSIGMRQMFNISTSDKGTFEMIWSPNFLATEGALSTVLDPELPLTSVVKPYGYAYSNLYVNNDTSLTGTGSKDAFGCLPCFQPMALLQKYRLVSALLKVKYNGSVLNQAGTLLSCATYETFPVIVAGGVTETTNDSPSLDVAAAMSLCKQQNANPSLARWTNFDIIRNGQWNLSHNISADANGIECLYVPVDPTSKMFYDVGDYYGTSIANSQDTTDYKYTVTNSSFHYETHIRQLLPFSETSVKYVVAGHNLPKSENCIQIELFYNFEVIADPTVAPLIRSSINNVFDINDKRRIKELFRELSKTGFVRRAWENVKENFPKFARATLTWGPRLLPLLTKFI